MSTRSKSHQDCEYLTPVDVVKGFCNFQNNLVMFDTPPCEKFVSAPKCAVCKHFHKGENDDEALCKAFSKNQWTYADLGARNCEKFELLS